MADKDRVKGDTGHPESTVEEGVGTLKGEAADLAKDRADRAKGGAGGAAGSAKNAVPDSTHTGSGDPRKQG